DHLLNHFGVEAYIGAVEAGRLPVARHLHLGALGGLAYDAFWQAYAGRIRTSDLAAAYGGWVAAVRALLPPLAAAGLLRRDDGAWALTPRGFAAYHDLERWVTYHLIEPLWAEMLEEHDAEGGRATWATPSAARRSRLWPHVARAMERDHTA
ncbi:MAG: hypothetical protein LPK38_06355, partial [Actinomycetes bacterium]|nr:hypothetical protein [Actinomycetes bacterium]MDX5450662.1 hypothetical protein [Actinomycetes bacterium]